MSNRPSLDDYVDVAERIAQFHEKYPEGTLQTVDWEPREIGGRIFIVYRAAAYRTPDDPRPGQGSAWEPFPGPTPYTKDSELMNAETAAWGRALVACGIVANRKIASRQEVRARQGERKVEEPKAASEPRATPEDIAHIKAAAHGLKLDTIRQQFGQVGLFPPDAATEPSRLFDRVPKAKAQLLAEVLAGVER